MSLAHRALAAILAVAGLVALAIPSAATAQAQSAAPEPIFFNNDDIRIEPLPGTLADWRLDSCGLAVQIVSESGSEIEVDLKWTPDLGAPGTQEIITTVTVAPGGTADIRIDDQVSLATFTHGNTAGFSLTAREGENSFGAGLPAFLDSNVARSGNCVRSSSLSSGSLLVDFGPNTLADGRTESCGFEVVLTNTANIAADAELWVAAGVRDIEADQAIQLPGAAAIVPAAPDPDNEVFSTVTLQVDDRELLSQFTAEETANLRIFARYTSADFDEEAGTGEIFWQGAIPWPSIVDPTLRESCDVQVQQTTTSTTVAPTTTTVAPTTTTAAPTTTTTAPQQVVVLQSTLPVTGSTPLPKVAGALMLLASGLVCLAGRRNLLAGVRA
ncbi:MAG: hypothetical protein S0880_11005 [Actinomycetota bacterium]|nr:hypothetical protein [Actinomycetota bacterium]